MCAIAGIVTREQKISAAHHQELADLLSAMAHRGPDGRGVRECAPWVLLGSNRLRITDAANARADMPLLTHDERLVIVFNGEIYNQRALRRELEHYPFATACDTEVILAAYQAWGSACVERLEGMFAFAIYDREQDMVFLACDPAGQKTVYCLEDGDTLVFASEANALLADAYRDKDWDLNGLAEYTAHRFILGTDTHVKQIKKLEGGTSLERTRAGQRRRRFHRVRRGDLSSRDVERAAARIEDSVLGGGRDCFDVEVPYGLLLSGGIDSSVVLASACRAGLNPRTFSIGFDWRGPKLAGTGSTFDEFAYSRQVAQHFGTEHSEIKLTDDEYCRYLDRWIDVAGEPLGSQEAPCLLKLLEAASQAVRVVFAGSGPDEIFDGYSYGRTLADAPVSDLPRRYYRSFQWCGPADLERLMPDHAPARLTQAKYEEILGRYHDWPLDSLQAVQLLHFHGRLGVYEFRQLDLVSMRHSVEARSPLANTRSVDAAFAFHSDLKQLDGEEKGIYKRALSRLVPPAVAARRKQGFPIPAEMWFSPSFVERAAILFDSSCVLCGIGLIDAKYLRALWDDPNPATRNLFSRLYTAEGILRRQAPQLGRRRDVRDA